MRFSTTWPEVSTGERHSPFAVITCDDALVPTWVRWGETVDQVLDRQRRAFVREASIQISRVSSRNVLLLVRDGVGTTHAHWMKTASPATRLRQIADELYGGAL